MFLAIALAGDAAGAGDVAGFAAVVVVAAAASFLAGFAGAGAITASSFFWAGAVASAGVLSGVVSTVADAFSSVAGAVDSAGAGDSSWASAIADKNSDAKNGTMIFMWV